MMVRVASGHFAGNVNLGGIAEVYNAFVPCIWGRGVFRIPNEPGFSSKHAANSREPGNTECSQDLPGGVERMILSSRQPPPAKPTVTSAI